MTTTIIPDIHPEIPKAEWVSNRYLDDDGRVVVDEHRYQTERFEITRDITHSVEEDGTVRTGQENFLINWVNAWGDGVDHESMVVLAADLSEFSTLFTLLTEMIEAEQQR